MQNGSYFTTDITRRLLEPADRTIHDVLTQRQIEILKLIAEGNSAKEIGFKLGLSPKTVDVHRLRIMERLGLHDIASLTLYSLRNGLIKA
jgi:DNA-binding NarL/FixJ family response regulator